jgi:hypothetical protein
MTVDDNAEFGNNISNQILQDSQKLIFTAQDYEDIHNLGGHRPQTCDLGNP